MIVAELELQDRQKRNRQAQGTKTRNALLLIPVLMNCIRIENLDVSFRYLKLRVFVQVG